jgi:hypothetical protein
MDRRIDRRLVLASALLFVAGCTSPVSLPAFHLGTTHESREPFFEAIRAFARTERFKLEERRGALGTIAFFQFFLSGRRASITIGSDINAPVASFSAFSNLFRVDVTSTQEPMPWALHDAGLRALAARLQAALTAVPGVAVVNLPESPEQPSP